MTENQNPTHTHTYPPLRLDNSKRATFLECPRKYFIEYEKHLRTLNGSTPLRYGLAWHRGLEATYTADWENSYPSSSALALHSILHANETFDAETDKATNWFPDYRTKQNLAEAFYHYWQQFAVDFQNFEILSAEEPFEITLLPSTPKQGIFYKTSGLYAFQFVGIIDLCIKTSGATWLFDHKTTSQPIYREAERLERSYQFLGYANAARRWLSLPVQGAIISFHHLSSTKSRKTGLYGKSRIEFARQPVLYTPSDYTAFEDHLWWVASQIHQCRTNNYFPRNPDSCFNKYGKCRYYDIFPHSMSELLDPSFIPPNFQEVEPWDPVTNRTNSPKSKAKSKSKES